MPPRRRRLLLLAAAVASAWPAVASAPRSGRIVWHEFHERTHRGPFSHASNHVEYRIVEERDTEGAARTLAHTLTWASEGEGQHRGVVMARHGRQGRTEGDYSVSCAGGGSFDLGTDAASYEHAQSQIAAARTRCSHSHPPAQWAVAHSAHPLIWDSPGVGLAPMNWEQLGERCDWSESKTWTDDVGTHAQSHHVWVSQLEAVAEIETADAEALKRFVPQPGRWLAISVRSNVPTLFRFELDGVSAYPGFATNAKVDDDFFLRSGLAPLRGRYKNDDPDFIFDPWSYEGQPAWKWNGWTAVETTQPSSAATIFVTAMDFAAWGRLRVLAKGECRGWEPAEIRMDGRSRGSLVLPIDDNDDLMADALPEYAGDAGRDDELGRVDADFPDETKLGDGLTALEEYRGFLVRGADCREARRDQHVRTSPKRRDLFVNATDPALDRPVEMFADSADIEPHLICARHYVDDTKRVVNATLQDAGPRRFHGYEISQSEPQHGLLLQKHSLTPGTFGLASTTGTPKDVKWVRVDLDQSLRQGGTSGPAKLLNAVTHELGHALNIKHHGDGNSLVPIVVLDRASCPAGTRNGKVGGTSACEYSFVALRHAQTSGDADCPMKYAFWSWYVPPGSKLEKVGNVELVVRRADGSEERVPRVAYRLTGTLKRYERAQDTWGLGDFCGSQKGTWINALPGDRNHAGDSTRICAQQLRVNDVR